VRRARATTSGSMPPRSERDASSSDGGSERGGLRGRAAALVELPPLERVDYKTVTGKPWLAFNEYRGVSRASSR
jgi:hypothetical protein